MSVNDIILASSVSSAVTPISLVAHTKATSGSTTAPATTSAINTTGATLLVVGVSGYGSDTFSVVDSKSNTWTALTKYTATNPAVQLFYCANPAVGSGHTFEADYTGSLGYIGIVASAWNLTLNAAADAATGATVAAAGAATIQPGTVTPSAANCLVVTSLCYFDQAAARAATISAGFTTTDVLTDGTYSCQGMAYQVQTTATGVNPTWTCPQNQYGIATAIAVFKHS